MNTAARWAAEPLVAEDAQARMDALLEERLAAADTDLPEEHEKKVEQHRTKKGFMAVRDE